MDLIKEIEKLKKQKDAIILAHYYQVPEIQDIADYIGDSLGLAQKAAEAKAKIIVFAGVHFMAETAKMLNPKTKVVLPDLEAGCSLADSCPLDKFVEFKENIRIIWSFHTSTLLQPLKRLPMWFVLQEMLFKL